MADEIIEEVWRIKDEIAREHGYDLDRLGADLVRVGREREGRERERATAGEGNATADPAPATWVEAEFGPRRGGGGDRAER